MMRATDLTNGVPMPLRIVGGAHETPETASFIWFIYGSSLSRTAFAEWAERHGYAVPDFAGAFPARLSGYRLSFDVQSGFWGGAVASLTEEPVARVEGVALPLPGSSRTLVDHKEGALSGLYEPFAVRVTPLAGGDPVEAIAFRASPQRRMAKEAPPSPTFAAALRAGASEWGLSEGWRAELARLGLGTG
jgi:gamma-glutamylcyclotransferase